MTIALVSLSSVIAFLGMVLLWVLREARNERQDLINSLIAKNLGEYALASAKLRSSTKDEIKRLRAENDLALAAERMRENQGIPIR